MESWQSELNTEVVELYNKSFNRFCAAAVALVLLFSVSACSYFFETENEKAARMALHDFAYEIYNDGAPMKYYGDSDRRILVDILVESFKEVANDNGVEIDETKLREQLGHEFDTQLNDPNSEMNIGARKRGKADMDTYCKNNGMSSNEFISHLKNDTARKLGIIIESSGDVANFSDLKLVKEGGAWKLSIFSNSQAREFVKKEVKEAILSTVQAEQKSANDLAKCESNLKNLGTACEMYATDNGNLYPSNLTRLTYGYNGQQPYMKSIPTCPTCYSSYSYEYNRNPDVYTLQCNGDHRKLGIEEGYPKFTATIGLVRSADEMPQYSY